MQIKFYLHVVCVFLLLPLISYAGSTKLVDNMGLGGGAMTWSPDGKKIAFASSQGSPYKMVTNIWVMNSDGSGKKMLTSASTWDNYPDWSPDGQIIVYSSRSNPSQPYQLWQMDVDGSNNKRITFDKDSYLTPRWSPNGREIVYTSGNNRIGIIDKKGLTAKQLTFTKSTSPNWTADGRIIYAEYSATGRYDIFIMSSDGTQKTSILSSAIYEMSPEVSPSGHQIVYEQWDTKKNKKRVTVANADGSQPKYVTQTGVDEGSGRWSPTGNKVAYNTWVADKNELWVADVPPPSVVRNLPALSDNLPEAKLAKATPKKKTQDIVTKIKKADRIPEKQITINNYDYKIANIFTSSSFNPGRKKAFNKKGAFSINDERVWILINFQELKTPCKIQYIFYAPDGNSYYTTETDWMQSIDPVMNIQFDHGTFMSIKGSPAEYMTGKWTVKILIKFENTEFKPMILNGMENWHLYFTIEN